MPEIKKEKKFEKQIHSKGRRAGTSLKTEEDRLRPSRKKSPEPTWWGVDRSKWYILIGLSIIVSIILFPHTLVPKKTYSLGDIAKEDIKASRDFLVENNELTERRIQEALVRVPLVYDFDPTYADVAERIERAFDMARENFNGIVVEKDAAGNESPGISGINEGDSVMSLGRRFFDILNIDPDKVLLDALIKNGFSGEMEQSVMALLKPIITKGVVANRKMLMNQGDEGIILHNIQTHKDTKIVDLERFYDLETAGTLIKRRAEKLPVSKRMSSIAKDLASRLLRPNLTFNKRETEVRKESARQSVKPFFFKVKKGEMLVREGEKITEEHLIKLSEEQQTQSIGKSLGKAPAMALLLGLLIATMHLVGLMKGRSPRNEMKDMLFIATTLVAVFLVVFISELIAREIAKGVNYISPISLLFAVPVASGAMLISVFMGRRVAATFSLLAAVLASFVITGKVEFFAYFFVGSLVGAAGVENCRERGALIKAGLKVGAVNMALAVAIMVLEGSFYTMESLIAPASAFIGGVLSGVAASGLMSLVEMSFGYTSDIKLLELASLDRPLLQELMVQAQGTYHHSVIVSNMVEASAKSIHANSLLAKVAAYYHDIGKIKKPLYFVENQLEGVNKHEKLAPSMSSLILIAHVKDGVELARKHKLGAEIIDIIRQHHGTSLITFFYGKARDQAEKKSRKSGEIDEENFRYPGPKPQTKEAGLVMLADAVEAAARSLSNPTGARIQGTVQKIINRMFSEGQLDECELTLKDLHKIAKSFNQTLSGIFHQRIEYPELLAKGVNGKKKRTEDGRTDQLSSGDSVAKKKQNKDEPADSLKRLGIS